MFDVDVGQWTSVEGNNKEPRYVVNSDCFSADGKGRELFGVIGPHGKLKNFAFFSFQVEFPLLSPVVNFGYFNLS